MPCTPQRACACVPPPSAAGMLAWVCICSLHQSSRECGHAHASTRLAHRHGCWHGPATLLAARCLRGQRRAALPLLFSCPIASGRMWMPADVTLSLLSWPWPCCSHSTTQPACVRLLHRHVLRRRLACSTDDGIDASDLALESLECMGSIGLSRWQHAHALQYRCL